MKRHLGLFNLPPYLNLLKAFMLIAFCTSSVSNNTLHAGGSLCETDCQHLGQYEEDEEVDVSELSAGYFNTCTWIYGTLNIDQNQLIDGAQIVMMPGSQIVVEQNYSLTLVNSRLIGCDTLWRGITVESGANIYCSNDTIEDANTAIFLNGGASITALDSRFENNYIGIATGLPNYEIATPITVHGQIYGNTFISTDDLLTPYFGHYYYYSGWPTGSNVPFEKSYAAVYLRSTSGLNIGLESYNASWTNHVYGLRNGVLLDSSNADVFHCEIEDLAGALTSSQSILDLTSTGICAVGSVSNIKYNVIDNIQDGIVSQGSHTAIFKNDINLTLSQNVRRLETRGISVLNTTQETTVDSNIIHDANFGIYVNNIFRANVDLTRNIITADDDELTRVGIYISRFLVVDDQLSLIDENDILLTNADSSIGIAISLANGLQVSYNDIEFDRSNSHDPLFTAGIWTQRCNGSVIERNNITGEGDYSHADHYGIFYQGSRGTTVFCNVIDSLVSAFAGSGMCESSEITANKLNLSNPIGLLLNAPTLLGDQLHMGNEWGGNTHSDSGARIVGSNANETADASSFFIEDDGMCDNWPCPIFPGIVANIWFQDVVGTDSVCYGEPVPPELDDGDYEDFLMSIPSFSDYGDEMTWMAKKWIFSAILLDEDLLQNTRLDSFFDAEDSNPLSVLAMADFAINPPFDKSSELLEVGVEILDSLFVISAIDLALVNLSPDSNALRSRRETAVDEISTLHTDRVALLDEWETDRQAEWSTAETALSSLTTSTDFEEYYLRALLYEYELRTSGLSSLSSSDWDEIQEIAALCAWEGGSASAIGQSICAFGRDSLFAPGLPCTGVQPRSSELVTQEIRSLTVYPNPSGAGWNIDVPEEAKSIQLTNSEGLYIKTIAVDRGPLYLSANQLPSGMYVLLAFDSTGKLIAQNKLILNK